jgi:hypothetical protein
MTLTVYSSAYERNSQRLKNHSPGAAKRSFLALILMVFVAEAWIAPRPSLAAQLDVTVTPSSLTFSDLDPDLTPNISASQNPVSISIVAKGTQNYLLTVVANGDLTSPNDSIPISNISWTASGSGYVSGTLSASTPQTVASGHNTGNNTYNGSLSFSFKNYWSYATGSYSASLTYVATSP